MLVRYIEENWGGLLKGGIYETPGSIVNKSGTRQYKVQGYLLNDYRVEIVTFKDYVKCLK